MDQAANEMTTKKLCAKDDAAMQLLLAEGNAAFDDDNFECALDCYHRASVLDGTDPDIWNLLGLTYANLEFQQEAWRSYKLALQIDPDNLDSLWYSGEFLFEIEDMALAGVVLSRYAELEQDEEKRNEARELLKEVVLVLGENDGQHTQPQVSSEDYDLADEADDGDQFEGFEVDGAEGEAGQEAANDIDDDEFDGVEDHEDFDEGGFVAHLSLQLERADSKCNSCQTAIPIDAPYCYSCKAPNFYETR